MFVGGPNIPTLGAIAMLQMGRRSRVLGGGSLSETDEEFEQRMAEWEADDRAISTLVLMALFGTAVGMLVMCAMIVF